MSSADLVQAVIATALPLIDASEGGEIYGEDVAEAMGYDRHSPAIHDALRAARDQGRLRCEFPGPDSWMPVISRP